MSWQSLLSAVESRSEGDNLCTRPDEFLRNIWNAATVVRVRLDVRWRTVGDLAPQLTHVCPEGCHGCWILKKNGKDSKPRSSGQSEAPTQE